MQDEQPKESLAPTAEPGITETPESMAESGQPEETPEPPKRTAR